MKQLDLEIENFDLPSLLAAKSFKQNNYVVGDKVPQKKRFQPKQLKSKKNQEQPKPWVQIDLLVDAQIHSNTTVDDYRMKMKAIIDKKKSEVNYLQKNKPEFLVLYNGDFSGTQIYCYQMKRVFQELLQGQLNKCKNTLNFLLNQLRTPTEQMHIKYLESILLFSEKNLQGALQ